MEHSEKQEALKNIDGLSGISFLVKDYQRGYRWKCTDVERLLDDLLAFQKERVQAIGAPYCLQPIVVRTILANKEYELIDGQQRLTTLFIILKCLAANDERCARPAFEITYKTRSETSGNFLKTDFYTVDIDKPWTEYVRENSGIDRIDNYHFYQAAKVAQKWAADHLETPDERRSFGQLILDHVKVIWYEPQTNESSEEIFSRLNVGKIPLTNAELLKAYFLQHHPERAQKWNTMEQAFEDDEFWGFLGNKPAKSASRMDFLFNLISKPSERETDAYYTFSEIAGMAEGAWEKVISTFRALQNLFLDIPLYHAVGTGIALGIKPAWYLREYENAPTLTKFEKVVKDELKAKTGDGPLTKILYGDTETGRHIWPVLLLANVLHSERRFSFARFYKFPYDIEHIHATATEPPDHEADCKAWLTGEQRVLDNWPDKNGYKEKADQLSASINDYLAQENHLKGGEERRQAFLAVDEKIKKFYRENGDETGIQNGLNNLALLDSRTNRGFKNASFAAKRDCIRDAISAPDYKDQPLLLPLTLRAFQKFHTSQPQEMLFWRKSDGEDYVKAICTTLANFFKN